MTHQYEPTGTSTLRAGHAPTHMTFAASWIVTHVPELCLLVTSHIINHDYDRLLFICSSLWIPGFHIPGVYQPKPENVHFKYNKFQKAKCEFSICYVLFCIHTSEVINSMDLIVYVILRWFKVQRPLEIIGAGFQNSQDMKFAGVEAPYIKWYICIQPTCILPHTWNLSRLLLIT